MTTAEASITTVTERDLTRRAHFSQVTCSVIGGAEGTRTPGLLIANGPTLSQTLFLQAQTATTAGVCNAVIAPRGYPGGTCADRVSTAPPRHAGRGTSPNPGTAPWTQRLPRRAWAVRSPASPISSFRLATPPHSRGFEENKSERWVDRGVAASPVGAGDNPNTRAASWAVTRAATCGCTVMHQSVLESLRRSAGPALRASGPRIRGGRREHG